jgi:hypothetical protein
MEQTGTDKQQLQPVNFVPLRYTKQQVVQQGVVFNAGLPRKPKPNKTGRRK